MPKIQHKQSKSSTSTVPLQVHEEDELMHDPEKIIIEADSVLAHALQPLLEQEALLE